VGAFAAGSVVLAEADRGDPLRLVDEDQLVGADQQLQLRRGLARKRPADARLIAAQVDGEHVTSGLGVACV